MKPNQDEKNVDTVFLSNQDSELSIESSNDKSLKVNNLENSFQEEVDIVTQDIHNQNSQSEFKNEFKDESIDPKNETSLLEDKFNVNNEVKMNGHSDLDLQPVNNSLLTHDSSFSEKLNNFEQENFENDSKLNESQEISQNESHELIEKEIKEKTDCQKEKDIQIENLDKTENLIKIENNESSIKIEEENNNEFVEVFGNCDLLKRTIKKVNDNNLLSEPGCELIINIESRNHETNEVIKSETFENFTIYVGDFDVIQGIDIAIKDMRVGEIAEILVKPKLAYGILGKKPDVPSNCTLLCKIEILENKFLDSMNCKIFADLEKYMKICIRKKERGNFFFNRGENETALHCYVKSGEILDLLGVNLIDKHTELSNLNKVNQDEIKKNEIDKELEKLSILSEEFMKTKLIVYNNISAVQIKMKLFNDALLSVNNALKIDGENLKALFRKATILKHKGELDLAIKTLEYAILFEPQNKKFLNDLKSLKISRSKEKKREKALYQKMMNAKKVIEKKDESYSNLTLISGGLIITGLVLGSLFLYKKMNK